MDLKAKLREVPDFPKEGINFIDITTVLQDAGALKQCIDQMIQEIKSFGDFDMIVGPESRGFIFGTPIAYAMGKGFAPIRKKGKLPYKTISVEYELEYGKDNWLYERGNCIKAIVVAESMPTAGENHSRPIFQVK